MHGRGRMTIDPQGDEPGRCPTRIRKSFSDFRLQLAVWALSARQVRAGLL